MGDNEQNTITTTGQFQDLIKNKDNLLAVFTLKGSR